MLKITKEVIDIDENILGRINNICKFHNLNAKVICGSIRHVECTNIAYIEPHRVIINNILYLFFNNSDKIFINNLTNSIKLSELEDYILNN